MMTMSNDTNGWGGSHLANLPVTVMFAAVIAFALVALALLRHLFGNIRVEAGTH